MPRQAAKQWQGEQASTRVLRLSMVSTLLKTECCVSGTHSMDLVGLGAFGLYETLPGLDCTFPRWAYTHTHTHTHSDTLSAMVYGIHAVFGTHGLVLVMLLSASPQRGYHGLIDSMMKELPGGVVSYRRPVHCVHWGRDRTGDTGQAPVVVECQDGERIPADHVIVTVPLGR